MATAIEKQVHEKVQSWLEEVRSGNEAPPVIQANAGLNMQFGLVACSYDETEGVPSVILEYALDDVVFKLEICTETDGPEAIAFLGQDEIQFSVEGEEGRVVRGQRSGPVKTDEVGN